MKSIHEEWSNLSRLVSMIAAQFGTRCEVVLHDLTQNYNHTIVAIENGSITNRTIGGSGSNYGLPVLSGREKSGDTYNYITKTKDGKMLRSSTTYFTDDESKVVGALCINYDITDLLKMDDLLKEVIMYPAKENEEEEIFANNVGEILDHLTSQCLEYIGKPCQEMSKEDKINAIEYFDRKGAFLISKAGDHIRDFLNISKYTLYNYLEIARTRSD